MPNVFMALKELLERTDKAVGEFMDMITPTIENEKDEHEHVYWHHIYEEEQRKDRLSALLPKLENYVRNEEQR